MLLGKCSGESRYLLQQYAIIDNFTQDRIEVVVSRLIHPPHCGPIISEMLGKSRGHVPLLEGAIDRCLEPDSISMSLLVNMSPNVEDIPEHDAV